MGFAANLGTSIIGWHQKVQPPFLQDALEKGV